MNNKTMSEELSELLYEDDGVPNQVARKIQRLLQILQYEVARELWIKYSKESKAYYDVVLAGATSGTEYTLFLEFPDWLDKQREK